ncbi:MAG: GTP-binding protein [Collinsella sp.]
MSEVQALVECPVIVGTAGHVDHGKSALIEALTGKNPDRLEVERRRGMTVELGFGELALPSGKIVGLVDVPGHALPARHGAGCDGHRRCRAGGLCREG